MVVSWKRLFTDNCYWAMSRCFTEWCASYHAISCNTREKNWEIRKQLFQTSSRPRYRPSRVTNSDKAGRWTRVATNPRNLLRGDTGESRHLVSSSWSGKTGCVYVKWKRQVIMCYLQWTCLPLGPISRVRTRPRRWIFKDDKNLQHNFLRMGCKARGPMS
jgi:hypothetical protein